jgi:hypothetical protein
VQQSPRANKIWTWFLAPSDPRDERFAMKAIAIFSIRRDEVTRNARLRSIQSSGGSISS